MVLEIYLEIMILNENSYIYIYIYIYFVDLLYVFLMSFSSLTVTSDEFAVALKICSFRRATNWARMGLRG